MVLIFWVQKRERKRERERERESERCEQDCSFCVNDPKWVVTMRGSNRCDEKIKIMQA